MCVCCFTIMEYILIKIFANTRTLHVCLIGNEIEYIYIYVATIFKSSKKVKFDTILHSKLNS